MVVLLQGGLRSSKDGRNGGGKSVLVTHCMRGDCPGCGGGKMLGRVLVFRYLPMTSDLIYRRLTRLCRRGLRGLSRMMRMFRRCLGWTAGSNHELKLFSGIWRGAQRSAEILSFSDHPRTWYGCAKHARKRELSVQMGISNKIVLIMLGSSLHEHRRALRISVWQHCDPHLL